MSDNGHLSDLQLDQLRIAAKDGKADPGNLRHIESCGSCHQRIEEIEQLAESVRPELAGVLARAEKQAEAHRRDPLGWRIPTMVAAGLCGLALLVILLVPTRSKQPSTEDIRVKGVSTMKVMLPGSGKDPGQVLAVGQRVRVRLSGTPAPRSLILRDVDGTWRMLWPRERDSQARAGDTVELDLDVGEPPGELTLTALFGPKQLTNDTALRLAKALRSNPRASLPKGTKAARRAFQVVAW
jgi:hypothetical protein